MSIEIRNPYTTGLGLEFSQNGCELQLRSERGAQGWYDIFVAFIFPMSIAIGLIFLRKMNELWRLTAGVLIPMSVYIIVLDRLRLYSFRVTDTEIKITRSLPLLPFYKYDSIPLIDIRSVVVKHGKQTAIVFNLNKKKKTIKLRGPNRSTEAAAQSLVEALNVMRLGEEPHGGLSCR